MDIRQISPELSVSPQITVADVGVAASQGFRAIICNRPDGESFDQAPVEEIRVAAEANGMAFRNIPVIPGQLGPAQVAAFAEAMNALPGPVLAYCRSGTRSCTLWALAKAPRLAPDAILRAAAEAGYDLAGLRPALEGAEDRAIPVPMARRCDVVIVGGGAGGIAAAASIRKRRPDLDVVIVEPGEEHHYQPGWTLVGAGVFRREDALRPMAQVIPKGVSWIRAAVSGFEPSVRQVVLEDGERLAYRALVVATGLKLDWGAVEGLGDTLGRNGVTSNYLFDMAPYTWELVQSLRGGKALFTQPRMPIKCAGAPQMAMYLSADTWRRKGQSGDVAIEFCTAEDVLFGVADYLPALMSYVKKYDVTLSPRHDLVAVDGPARKAWFEVTGPEGTRRVERDFDMLHVCPPQTGLDCIKASPLADAGGWVEVNPETLQHVRFGDVFSLGDACSAPNAKTAGAVRKQAPVVAENIIAVIEGRAPRAVYDGYGSCPLTVERGRIVLAEFGYGGKLDPSFPGWLIDGTKPSRLSWFLKERLLPPFYWHAMFKAREWRAAPRILPMSPAAHEAAPSCDFSDRGKTS